ncbi:molybdate transport system substrate-binding protein [Paucidesulfovibrio gracilis DSM 16080]|uniref:Molybdate transport system substrate-binding protein n=1 Tax=Paucidesulfovibrio gracilis DSM 16080 TaxID=1121449 RepID=A0A1T4X4Y6_9BACT|nr:molybdate ABC transporter substrate-binding protein [Paucidesulfovibrio gracilis]SKA84713.1 molybdate transport system substrate-binding protein [Paucidesulfovibrio gracilis DSM 16080]
MKRLLALVMLLAIALPLPASAADLLVAQAANFMPAMKEIIPVFEQQTGLEVDATYTSTGKLYGQIVNGAPFDVFLAADQRRPDKLFADGLCSEPFVYAKGQIVLWSLNPQLCKGDWTKAAQHTDAVKVAIANVENAPYGNAAMVAMQKAEIWDAMQSRLVFGQNIAQVFQYASTGAADAGFCAYSSVFTEQGQKGCFVEIPQAPDVIQAACILNSAPHSEAAAKFVEFLATPEVAAIKAKYGYK